MEKRLSIIGGTESLFNLRRTRRFHFPFIPWVDVNRTMIGAETGSKNKVELHVFRAPATGAPAPGARRLLYSGWPWYRHLLASLWVLILWLFVGADLRLCWVQAPPGTRFPGRKLWFQTHVRTPDATCTEMVVSVVVDLKYTIKDSEQLVRGLLLEPRRRRLHVWDVDQAILDVAAPLIGRLLQQREAATPADALGALPALIAYRTSESSGGTVHGEGGELGLDIRNEVEKRLGVALQELSADGLPCIEPAGTFFTFVEELRLRTWADGGGDACRRDAVEAGLRQHVYAMAHHPTEDSFLRASLSPHLIRAIDEQRRQTRPFRATWLYRIWAVPKFLYRLLVLVAPSLWLYLLSVLKAGYLAGYAPWVQWPAVVVLSYGAPLLYNAGGRFIQGTLQLVDRAFGGSVRPEQVVELAVNELFRALNDTKTNPAERPALRLAVAEGLQLLWLQSGAAGLPERDLQKFLDSHPVPFSLRLEALATRATDPSASRAADAPEGGGADEGAGDDPAHFADEAGADYLDDQTLDATETGEAGDFSASAGGLTTPALAWFQRAGRVGAPDWGYRSLDLGTVAIRAELGLNARGVDDLDAAAAGRHWTLLAIRHSARGQALFYAALPAPHPARADTLRIRTEPACPAGSGRERAYYSVEILNAIRVRRLLRDPFPAEIQGVGEVRRAHIHWVLDESLSHSQRQHVATAISTVFGRLQWSQNFARHPAEPPTDFIQHRVLGLRDANHLAPRRPQEVLTAHGGTLDEALESWRNGPVVVEACDAEIPWEIALQQALNELEGAKPPLADVCFVVLVGTRGPHRPVEVGSIHAPAAEPLRKGGPLTGKSPAPANPLLAEFEKVVEGRGPGAWIEERRLAGARFVVDPAADWEKCVARLRGSDAPARVLTGIRLWHPIERARADDNSLVYEHLEGHFAEFWRAVSGHDGPARVADANSVRTEVERVAGLVRARLESTRLPVNGVLPAGIELLALPAPLAGGAP